MPAVVVQSRRAGAGPATPDAAILPGTGVGTTAAGASTPSPAPKRLHQSLGARRHSTEVIQPSGLRFLLSCPKPPEYTPGDIHLKFTRVQSPERDGIKLLHKFRPLENKIFKIQFPQVSCSKMYRSLASGYNYFRQLPAFLYPASL